MENFDIIQQKIKDLRDLHPDWDDISLVKIDRAERALTRNAEYADYCDLEMTREVVKQMEDIVKSIVVRLANEENMDDTERKCLFREKKAYLWLVTLLSKDYKERLFRLEKWLDFELGKK